MSMIVPTLFVKSRGEQTSKLALRLTTAPRKVVVRLTGGCAKMSAEDAEGLYELFTEAFDGYQGALLYGGTRMLRTPECTQVVPGITEVASAIRKQSPGCVLLGVVPRTRDMQFSEHGLIISGGLDRDHITIVHPDQDICLVVQVNADQPEKWDAEWQECQSIMQDLEDYAAFQPMLICYNGGSVTERELLATAKRGWPVLLVAGSGRMTDRYAADQEFLARHSNVSVVENHPQAMRKYLIQAGMLPPDKLRLVHGARVAEAN